jgi:hypothetical protein
VENFEREGQATYDDTVLRRKYALCMPDKEGKNTDRGS